MLLYFYVLFFSHPIFFYSGFATITWWCLQIATFDTKHIGTFITFKFIDQYTWNGLLESRLTITDCNKCTANNWFAQTSVFVAGKTCFELNFIQKWDDITVLFRFHLISTLDCKAIVEIYNMAIGPAVGVHYGRGCSLFFDIRSKFLRTFSTWTTIYKKERQLKWTKCHKFSE